MNREKLQKLRKEGAPSIFMREIIDALLEDDEPPRVDRSLRGWIHITDNEGDTSVRDAREDGVYDRELFTWTWDDIEEMGWTVRPLTPEDIGVKVRYPGEWTATEEDEFRASCDWTHDISLIAGKAIDIATRRTP